MTVRFCTPAARRQTKPIRLRSGMLDLVRRVRLWHRGVGICRMVNTAGGGMAIWKVEFFENHGDAEPSRVGLIKANSEDAAASIAARALAGREARADLSRSVVPDETTLPLDLTLLLVKV